MFGQLDARVWGGQDWGVQGGRQEGEQCTELKSKRLTYLNPHKSASSSLCCGCTGDTCADSQVMRPVVVPTLASGQASFGGYGVEKMASLLGSADWGGFFWCAG